MKNTLIVIILTLVAVTGFGQQQNKITIIEDKTVRAQHNKTSYSNQDPKLEDNKKANEEPVIILRLSSSDTSGSIEKTEAISETEIVPVPADNSTVKPVAKEKPVKSVDQQIQDLDIYINAIDTKVEWVKNNPDEDKKAKESGWYDKMNEYRNNSLAQKEKLLKSKK